MATYTQLRLAVLLATCFVTFANLVHGAPTSLANHLEQSASLIEEAHLMSSTNQNAENRQETPDSNSQVVSQSSIVSQELTAAATVGQDLTTAATVIVELTTAPTVIQELTTAASVGQKLITAATDTKTTSSVESVPSGEPHNATDSTTVPPTPEIKLTNKTMESTDKPLDEVEEPNTILESSSFTNQINLKTHTSGLQTTNKLMTYKSTNIMTLTTSANTESVTDQVMKDTDMVTKFTDVAQNTSSESSGLFPIIVPDIINTIQDTEIPLVTSTESHTEVPNDTSYNATEFTVADDLKGTTTYIPTVPMTESYKSTIEEVSSNSTISLITTNDRTIESEVPTDTTNEAIESPSRRLASDDISKITTANDTLSDTMIAELFNMTPPNLLLEENRQPTLSEPEKILNVSPETIQANTETNTASKITEISKTEPISANVEPINPTTEDPLTYKNVETNEIDRNLYLPIRKQYTAIERRKTTPITEAAMTTHYKIATEQAAKTSKKHLNVWVADLKLPDNDVDLTSIPRNPTSTMYPTLIDPTTPVPNSVVSRRAGYINNLPSIEQDIDKQPSSTNPVRASNPSLTDTFPNESILDISSTIPSYSLTTLTDRLNVITTPLTFPPTSMSTTIAPLITTAQASDTMLNSNLNSESSKISEKNISELAEFIETDVLPLSPSLVQKMRLVDDAMKEEFMKEMALSLNEKLARLSKTTPDNVDDEELATTIPRTTSISNVTEKLRNFTLYKVNPNYKPLKRLEIQPSKQFTIDPDDNSWRNESINSRGVVFKANNSSIVFTQVLKNKTEAELNNTKLSNKESKDEQPELRERLEKLAERRKYKKKYNTSSAGTEEVEDPKTFEAPRDVERSPIAKVLRPSVTKDFIPIFNKGDDMYDSNDDDDEQFSKLSNVDILKSTQAPKEPPVTYFPPNRKGTIQYFPPRKHGEQIKYNINFFATENSIPFPKVGTELPTSAPKIEKPIARKSMEPYDPKWRKEPENEREESPPGVYVIKHYRDFIRHATGDSAEDRRAIDEYPVHAEVLTKIVEDFNQNSEQFKAEFPVLYNTSVEHGGEAASRAYVRRMHDSRPGSRDTRPGSYLAHTRRYDPSCENFTVELNPAYELHYYVPDQEERQDAQLDAYNLENLQL